MEYVNTDEQMLFLNKSELRKNFLKIRKNVIEKDKKSKIIALKVLNLKIVKEAKIIAIYSSIDDEVDTTYISKELIKMEKTLCFPKTIKDKGLQFYKINNLDELKEIGVFKIKEPINNVDNLIESNYIDLIIMPGICFDKKLNRIGFGKGYYDKYLKNSKCYKIAICFSEQILKNNYINSMIYDVKADMIVSDKEIITSD